MEDSKGIFDSYYYAGTDTYINKKNITDKSRLQQFEVDTVAIKMLHMDIQPICGLHDMDHWKSIHKFMFADVYNWAGEFRKIEVFNEYGSPFSKPQKIQQGFDALVGSLLDKNHHFCKPTEKGIAHDISELMGELYYIHPFRDGNTRSLIAFTKAIAMDAALKIDLSSLRVQDWHDLQDSIVKAALERDTRALENIIAPCIVQANDKINDIKDFKLVILKHEQQHMIDTAATYTEVLKTYTQAKETKAQQIESKLGKAVAVQQASVAESLAHRPGLVSSLWRGSAWEQRQQKQAARLQVLKRRLERVRGIREDMGGKHLAGLARKKLQRDQPELVAKHDAEERQRRERQAEETLRLSREKEQTQSRGRRLKPER